MEKYEVIVIGGGLSGLSTAYYLSKEKKKVLLLEARHVVGGRTSSWIEKGMPVESGLHRFLGFYVELPNLLKEVGIDLDTMLFWEDEIEIILPDGGPQATFKLSPLHHPLKTISSFLGNNDFISPAEKVAITTFFTKGIADFARNSSELDKTSIYDYAKKHELSDELIQKVIEPLTTGLFFLPVKKYSAFSLFGLIPPAAPNLINTRIGAFLGGMTEVMTEPIADAIERNSGEVRRNAPVEELVVENDTVTGVVVKGEKIHASHVVVATSLVPAQRILEKHFKTHEWFSNFFSLPSMPAVTIQFELTEPSMAVDHTTFGPGTVMSSFAEQSRSTFRHVPGRLSVIISPPDRFLHMDHKEICQEVVKDAKRLGLNIEGNITDFRVVTEPHDFYSLSMNNQHLRPQQKTPIKGLTLAGDYTKQRFLATMEGAVISGQIASQTVLAS